MARLQCLADTPDVVARKSHDPGQEHWVEASPARRLHHRPTGAIPMFGQGSQLRVTGGPDVVRSDGRRGLQMAAFRTYIRHDTPSGAVPVQNKSARVSQVSGLLCAYCPYIIG